MREWFVRQYADIRGNLKWAVIGGLFWLANQYGKKMFNLIPHIPGWVSDLILFLLFVTAFVWLVKRMTQSNDLERPSTQGSDVSENNNVRYHDSRADSRVVKITKLSDQVETFPPGTYPLKLRMQLRNDSSDAIDVQMKEYRPGKEMASAKGFAQNVLQLRLGNQWFPGEGVGRIAVFPTQQFQAWIGLHEKFSNKPQIESHRGEIGTLVLLVNGRDVEVQL